MNSANKYLFQSILEVEVQTDNPLPYNPPEILKSLHKSHLKVKEAAIRLTPSPYYCKYPIPRTILAELKFSISTRNKSCYS